MIKNAELEVNMKKALQMIAAHESRTGGPLLDFEHEAKLYTDAASDVQNSLTGLESTDVTTSANLAKTALYKIAAYYYRQALQYNHGVTDTEIDEALTQRIAADREAARKFWQKIEDRTGENSDQIQQVFSKIVGLN